MLICFTKRTMKIIIIWLMICVSSFVYGTEENCDFRGTLVYEDLGCTPIINEGQKCPIKYDCHFKVQNNTCIHKGKILKLYEKVDDDEIYGACFAGCSCDETDKFECAELDCPEDPGTPGCYRTYKVRECCSVGHNCPTKSNPPFECKVEGVINIEGEKFYPKDTCLECVCDKGFQGKFEAPFCKRKVCGSEVEHSEKIHRYCAPHYDGSSPEALCCPSGWVCPSSTDKTLPPNPSANKNSDLSCIYGDRTLKLGERIQGKYTWYDGKEKDSQCECIVPPLLTCRSVPVVVS